MKISVIVPVYNVENYLGTCISSVLNQSFGEFELILVDDGSTDNSGKICDEFASEDKRIVVVHKTNGGLSSARNEGLKFAKGDYIFFLDSDDYISVDCLKRSIILCEEYGADIAIMRMLYIDEQTNEQLKDSSDIQIVEMNAEKAIQVSLYQKDFSCCAPSKLYKREIVEGTPFPEGRLSEDLATCHLFLDKAERVLYTNEIGYYYRQRNNSIMHVFNPKRMDALEWAVSIEHFCKEKYPSIENAAICRTFNVAVHLILDWQNLGTEYRKYFDEMWREIRRTRGNVLKNKEARTRERAAAFLSFFGYKMLKRVWHSKVAVKRENEY